MNAKIKLFVCDDHTLFRKGVISAFRNDPTIEVVGEAGNGRDAIERIKLGHPDVVLMDISMPGMNGLEATQRIVQSSKRTKVLILTMLDQDDLLLRCLETGASGYILKDAPFTELIGAVKEAFKGGKYLRPGIPNEVVNEYLREAVRPKDTCDRLSSRVRAILKLLAEGSSVQEIAFGLKLNVKTVEACEYNVMRKINAHDRTDLVEYAIRKEIVRVSSAKLSGKQSDRRAA